jgi:RNA polymerase sigma-70 factor (ECF subfamily)
MGNTKEADVQQHRKRLVALAYRLTGTLTDAEDIVQEAYLRWHRSANATEVRTPEAWLVTVVTRLCIDHLRTSKRDREAYPGPWLPEPVADAEHYEPERRAEISDDLSIAFLALLQTITDEERAAFVLREVLGYPYDDVSRALGKSEDATRQLVHRDRQHMRQGRVKRVVPAAEKERLIQRFLTAMEHGDERTVLELLAPNVSWTADGGGNVPGVVPKPVHGAGNVARLIGSIANKARGAVRAQIVSLVGEPALAFWSGDALYGVWALDFDGERISQFNNILNPQKCSHIQKTLSSRRT